MPVRRATDPLNLLCIWDAIKFSQHQKQVPDISRISKYAQKVLDCTPAQVETYLKQSVQDNFVIDVKKISQKGSNIGNEFDSFRINKSDDKIEPIDDGHDWYCIECHLAGDVNFCRLCHRVFHTECSKNASKRHTFLPKRTRQSDASSKNIESNESFTRERIDYIYDESLCSLCNIAEADIGTDLDLDEFNRLLGFIHLRIKSWLPDDLTNKLSPEQEVEWITPNEQRWRAMQLFYQHMDMTMVELKIRTNEYKSFSQFHADVFTMLHNVAIFHGVESQEFGAAELMLRDMKYDISEIHNCIDCYKHSNEKVNNWWFCLPCRVPHNLVWAKQTGYPHWPAKVIRETDTSCDVRFFGGKYERAVLPKTMIKPITTSMSQLQIKKTSGFTKALDELRKHQKLLLNPSEADKLMSLSSGNINQNNGRPSSIEPKKKPIRSKKVSIPKKINGNAEGTGFNESKRSFINESSSSNFSFIEKDKVDDIEEPVTKIDNITEELIIKRKRSISSEDTSISKQRKIVSLSVERLNELNNSEEQQDIINISDVEDDKEPSLEEEYNFCDSGVEQVTSSTELEREDVYKIRDNKTDGKMQVLDQPYSDAVERMRRRLESCKTKKQLIVMAMDCMQTEMDRILNDHNESLKKLFEVHNSQISETKKKQWCFNCEQDAIYHCCWNTAYCSPTCQQQHWQAEHKKVCRRKR